jgi:microcompartment protein CcmL/EutN
VAGVSAADVQAVSARWLNGERLTIAIAGDTAAIRGSLESLNMGAVHVEESG